MSNEIANLTRQFIRRIEGERLGIAESCTGGLASHLVTSCPGSSSVFAGGVIAYANDVKIQTLGVPEQVLKDHGAVSAETALFMALGVQKLLNVSISGSITGVAGPSGGTKEKPVGTVFMAIIHKKQEYLGKFSFSGDRAAVQQAAAERLIEAFYLIYQNEIPHGFTVY